MKKYFYIALFIGITITGQACKSNQLQKEESINKLDTLSGSYSVAAPVIQKQDTVDAVKVFIEEAKNNNFELLSLSNWNSSYLDAILKEKYKGTDTLLSLPPRTEFKALSAYSDGGVNLEEEQTVIFYDLRIRAIVMQQKTKSGNKPDFKLVEFSFADSSAAALYQTIFKDISRYTMSSKGLKSPNMIWQNGKNIYLLRTRATAFHIENVYSIFKNAINRDGLIL
jgi:hypothetical protein